MKVKTITGIGILSALTIVMTFISSVIPSIGASFNLSLVPIALAAILYGPLGGFIVGFVNGVFILVAPTTSVFYSMSVIGTIIVCLTKTSIGGLVSGFIFKHLKIKSKEVLASSVIPVLNTGIFILLALIFYRSAIGQFIDLFVLLNFGVEFISTILIVPIIYRTLLIKEK